MKVIFFSPKFYPEPNFYINDVVFDIQNVNKVIVCGKRFSFKDFRIISTLKGIKVYYIPYFGRSKNNVIDLLFEYLSFFIFSIFIIPFAVIKEKPKKVFHYGISPPLYILPFIILKIFFNFKIIYWIQDIWPESIFLRIKNSNIVYTFINVFMKLIYKYSDKLLVISKSFKYDKRFIKHKNKLTFIPQGLKISHPRNLCAESTNLIKVIRNEKRKTIIYTGNISNSMYLEEMSEAIAENYKNFAFYIIGNGPKLQSLKNKNYNSVFFYDYIERENIIDVVKAADFSFLGRKIDDKKNSIISKIMPGKLSLYSACGNPIIAIASYDLYNLIKDNNLGYSFKYTNKEDLCKNLNSLLQETEPERDIIQASQKFFFNQNFDHHNIIDRIYNIIIE